MESSSRSSSIGFSGLLFLLFLALKLTGHITWSWLWVTAPLWAPIGIFLLVIAIIFGVVISAAFGKLLVSLKARG